MTMREFCNAVINAGVSADVTEFAQKEIAKLDKRNATPSKADKEKAAQNALIKAKIVSVLKAAKRSMLTAAVAAAVGETTQKVSALLLQLCKDGVAIQSEVKVKGKGKFKAYALVETEDESAGETADESAE